MRKKIDSEKSLTRSSAWGGLLLVIVAAATLAATSLIQYLYSRDGIREEATARAQGELESTRYQILDIVDQAESAVRNSEWITRYCLDYPDSLVLVAQRLVRDNPVVMGSTVAMVPGYYKRRPLFAPYVFRNAAGELETKSLATEDYDYASKPWFTKPIEQGGAYWSEPYIDMGGGEELMTTYSLPIKDKQGRLAAVLTADISLSWLTDVVGDIKVYPHAFSILVSREGQIMVCPEKSLVMRKTVREVVSTMDDTVAVGAIGRSMLAGEQGEGVVVEKGVTNMVFFAPVERTGWSMSIVVPEKEVFGGIRRIGRIVNALQILGLLLLLLILFIVGRNLKRLNKINHQKEKMQNELHIARAIQMAMVPKTFPPFPDRHDIDMAATIVPAKEVGGDLYDFYIHDDRLFFCIGDVSGKGIPASLVMAVTRSLFRTVSAHEKSPQRIVTAMNESMSESNENNMFVTFFCGVLDMQTGHLRYCNAGHNAPVLLTDTISKLEVVPNLPLGIMKGMHFQEQEMDLRYDDAIFLYTDGLTEAENPVHELFGEKRMLEALHGRQASMNHLKSMEDAVRGFVAEAPQSDDLTMLFIHYLNETDPIESERHLILHNDINQIPQLAEFVEAIADEKSLDKGLAMSLNLALEEAVTNVIMYAYPPESDGLVDIEAILRKNDIKFIISDSGKEFDPTAAPLADTSLSAEERPIGGLGIFLVRNIMDSVKYERLDGKNVLTMDKRL